MSKKILFFGNERLATGVTTNTPVLKALVLNGYEILAIIVPSSDHQPSRKPRLLEVEVFAQTHNIPLLKLAKLKPAVELLKSYPAEIAILAAFGQIVPKEVIDIFPGGIVNIHPSLLPKHRGPTPIEAPILAGETKTGVSLMKLVPELDAGPIYDQQVINLQGTENKQQLADKLGELGGQRLIAVLPSILNKSLQPIEQNNHLASYDQKLTINQSTLDFSKPAAVLEREIRAFYGWPRSKTVLNQQPIIITQAHQLAGPTTNPGKVVIQNNQFGFETSLNILIIDRLIPAGGKEMSASDYLIGHQL